MHRFLYLLCIAMMLAPSAEAAGFACPLIAVDDFSIVERSPLERNLGTTGQTTVAAEGSRKVITIVGPEITAQSSISSIVPRCSASGIRFTLNIFVPTGGGMDDNARRRLIWRPVLKIVTNHNAQAYDITTAWLPQNASGASVDTASQFTIHIGNR